MLVLLVLSLEGGSVNPVTVLSLRPFIGGAWDEAESLVGEQEDTEEVDVEGFHSSDNDFPPGQREGCLQSRGGGTGSGAMSSTNSET